MELKHEDYAEIGSRIEEGKNYLEYYKDNEMLYIECTNKTEGYFEDDYWNGTGAYVITHREFSLDAVECYDENGERCEVEFSEKQLLNNII